MRNVLWICAAVASALTIADARAEGDGIAANADSVPWARLQGRVAYAPGAPGWRAELTPFERSGLQVGSVGLLGDVYFGASPTLRASSAGGFRATSGVLIGARNASLVGSSGSGGLFASDRRLFGASANSILNPADTSVDAGTVPYIGIGYSNLGVKSGWSFSADLGVVSQSPGDVVSLG